MTTNATLIVSYKQSNNFIYQTIQIISSKKSNIRYYIYDKYVMGRTVSDFLDTIYIGDGENIFFREKIKFRNQFTIKYEITNQIPIQLEQKKYHISGEVPKHDGCMHCIHFKKTRQGKNRCTLYKKFLDREKMFCSDFYEKDL